MKIDNLMMRGLQKKSSQGAMDVQTTAATHVGIGLKSLYYGLVTIVTAAVCYVLFYKFLGEENDAALTILLISAIASSIPLFILSIIISAAPKTVPVCGTIYCAIQGLFLSVMVALVDLALPGISLAAVLGTLILFCVALLFSRVLGARISNKLLLGLMTALCTIALTELVLWILSLIGLYTYTAIWWLQLVSCAIGVIFGTVMLMNNFQAAEDMVNRGVDKRYEWNVGFAIVTTLIYLYLEILELLIRIALATNKKKK